MMMKTLDDIWMVNNEGIEDRMMKRSDTRSIARTLADGAWSRRWPAAALHAWFMALRHAIGFSWVCQAPKTVRTGMICLIVLSGVSMGNSALPGQDSPGDETPAAVAIELSGESRELKTDDGTAAGRKSFPRGIAAPFQCEAQGVYLTGVKIHASRYGYPQIPKEDFTVTVCDPDFKPLRAFRFPYSKVERGEAEWVTLPVEPMPVPKDFVICFQFNPTRTKGVFISHDAEGKGLVGLPGKKSGAFTGGDWMVRATVDQPK